MEHTLEQETCQHCGLLPHVVSARKHGRMVCESPAMQELLRRRAALIMHLSPFSRFQCAHCPLARPDFAYVKTGGLQ